LTLVFFGTPAFALPALEVASAYDLAAVVVRRRGTPVATWAVAHGLTLVEAPRLAGETLERLVAIPFRVGVVAAYGARIPTELVRRGLLNVHPSLLPRWRGANPIRAALRHGDEEVGVSVLWLTEELDAGPVVWQQAVSVGPEDDHGSLSDRLARLGAEGLARVLADIEGGRWPSGVPQDPSRATYAGKWGGAEEVVPEGRSALETWRWVRSLTPEPGARMRLGGREVLVRQARFVPRGGPHPELPPDGLGVAGEALWQAFADGFLAYLRLQPPGRRAMSGADFARGYLRGQASGRG
jgi:methionyl-tRNA formyltransferase